MKTDIKRYEAMAKLEFDDREREWALAAFERILADSKKLDAISTDGIQPLISTSDVADILREDEVLESNLGLIFIGNAPDTENGYVRVPKAIE